MHPGTIPCDHVLHFACGVLCGLGTEQAQRDSANVGFVGDLRRDDLDGEWWFERAAGQGDVFGLWHEQSGRHRHTVSRQEELGFHLIEIGPALAPRLVQNALGLCDVVADLARLGRAVDQVCTGGAGGEQVAKAADGVFRRGVERNARALHRFMRVAGVVFAQPAGEHRLAPSLFL